jgi:hypothetical protein
MMFYGICGAKFSEIFRKTEKSQFGGRCQIEDSNCARAYGL